MVASGEKVAVQEGFRMVAVQRLQCWNSSGQHRIRVCRMQRSSEDQMHLLVFRARSAPQTRRLRVHQPTPSTYRP